MAAGSRPPLWPIVLATLVLAVSIVPALVMGGLSVMAFDSGPSPFAWALVTIVWSYPALVVTGLVAAWVLWARGRGRAALLACLLPLASPLALFVLAIAME